MVKKKGPIWDFFSIKGKGVACKYCCKEYKQSHAYKMANHIKKCFKCPQDLKKVLDLSTNIGKPIANKGVYEVVDVSGGFKKPGPSSAGTLSCACASSASPSPTSFSAGSSQTCSSSGFPMQSSPSTSKGITSFVDHMDIQTNVSKH